MKKRRLADLITRDISTKSYHWQWKCGCSLTSCPGHHSVWMQFNVMPRTHICYNIYRSLHASLQRLLLASSIITELIRIHLHTSEFICGTFVIYIHFRLQATISPWLDSIRTSAVTLLDLGIAVGISLLSRIAELHVISNELPVTGRHLWFITHPNGSV